VRGFRFQWPADLLTSCAFEMETLILAWYVLVETRSVVLLTVFGVLQFTGTLVAPMLGVMGDRIGHRNVLCTMRGIYSVLSAVLMTVAFAGALSPAFVLVMAGLNGLVRPADLGVRMALAGDLLPADDWVAAMGVLRTTSDCARIGGALAGAGMFAAFGMGPAYVAVFACYALGLLLTLAIQVAPRPRRPAAAATGTATPKPSTWRELKDGIAYACSSPQLLAAMLIAALVNLTAYPLSNGLLPYVAKEIYRIDQRGLGYLVAGFAAGALIGSLAVILRRGMRPTRVMIAAAVAWYAALLVFAQMRGALGGFGMLVLAGFAQSFCMVTLAVVLLQGTSEAFRGRVMGVRMLVIYTLPLGLLAAGGLIERIGFHATATIYACAGLLLVSAIAVCWRAELWHPRPAAGGDRGT
jgi:predicted MFS family arabinose efflux permease